MGTHHTADQGHKTPRALRAKSADVVGAQRAQGSPWSGYAWWVLQRANGDPGEGNSPEVGLIIFHSPLLAVTFTTQQINS